MRRNTVIWYIDDIRIVAQNCLCDIFRCHDDANSWSEDQTLAGLKCYWHFAGYQTPRSLSRLTTRQWIVSTMMQLLRFKSARPRLNNHYADNNPRTVTVSDMSPRDNTHRNNCLVLFNLILDFKLISNRIMYTVCQRHMSHFYLTELVTRSGICDSIWYVTLSVCLGRDALWRNGAS